MALFYLLILGESEVEIRWFVPENQEPGTYRISHYGAQKNLLKGQIEHYSGVTNSFQVSITYLNDLIETKYCIILKFD